MNISINSFDFDIHNVSFLEPKKNILMEGYFTKINYLSQWFTMSGLFFYLPIKIKSIIKEKSSLLLFRGDPMFFIFLKEPLFNFE